MVAAGRMTFPAHVVGMLSKARNASRSRAGGWDSLSDRERDVLYLTAAGYTAEEIARRIHLAPKTVANYRMSLKTKLGVQSRVDLMRVVVESGHLADMLKTAGIGPKNP